MPILLDASHNRYHPFRYHLEADFEAKVVELTDYLFGPTTIYVDVKRKIRGGDIASIPDGYVIDMTQPAEPKLFVVENEIVSHDPFKHIGIQFLKFVTSFDEAQRGIREILMKEIAGNSEMLRRLEYGCEQSATRNIDAYLDLAVYGEFAGLVVIDEARPELHRVLEKINANISVLELRTFRSPSGALVHEFDTLYDEEEPVDEGVPTVSPSTNEDTADEQRRRLERRAASDTVIVPAREEGFREEFLGNHQWMAISIGAAMKARIRYIAAYRVLPVSAVTHIAEVQEIKPWKDSGKYQLIFKGPAEEIRPIPAGDTNVQRPVYVQRARLLAAGSVSEAMKL